MFSAGETSGEQHAAHMYLELKQHIPDIQGLGMGGETMRRAGIDVRVDSSGIGVIGLFEVLKHYREISQALTAMKRLIADEKPDLLVCVDYKEFNYKLARYAKAIGVKVLFYVSPQVWAWRSGRVKKYGRAIDMMAVIFPFETPYYEAENVPVRYVGHPSVDKVRPLRSKAEDLTRYGLEEQQAVVGILPGSRRNEIEKILPVLLGAAERIEKQCHGVRFILPQAHSIPDELLCRYLDNTRLTIQVVKNEVYDVVQCCDAVMTTSGTATLEIALLGVPMVIVYKLAELTYRLGKVLVKTPFIGLPNIIAGRRIVKELIQHEANADNIADEILSILNDSVYRNAMLSALGEVKERMGAGEGSKNMANLALEMLCS
ncbi:MAG: lipid-A-disaccharide synthase [Gammaproteobacteria bacterium]